ncbi:MAG: hypothetical protein RQ754_09585 [Desulfuromonadales bacterium]|nr:hypothetical protein [Desulfuromonadales bacterium]
MECSVSSLARKLGVWTLVRQVVEQSSGNSAGALLETVAALPVRRSSAVRSLGSYVSRAGQPVCIRLQFAVEPETLRETFLHELAHLCDHLTNQPGKRYRKAHGSGWISWARRLGLDGRVRGRSEVLSELCQQRLKTVAVCRTCGAELRRLRRPSRRYQYLHRHCGGVFEPL